MAIPEGERVEKDGEEIYRMDAGDARRITSQCTPIARRGVHGLMMEV
jgi:hypothetical protein